MQLLESFKSLGSITGIANMVKEPIADVNCVENFLHMYGAIIMFFVCLVLLYLAIKKNYFGRDSYDQEVEVFYEDKDTVKRDGKIFKTVTFFGWEKLDLVDDMKRWFKISD